jgi:hypothetical protein
LLVQETVAPDDVMPDAVIPERLIGATNESVAGVEDPLNVAVTVAVWSDSRAPVLAVNVAEVALAGTLTEDGTVNTDGTLLESVTTVLLALDFARVTVQDVFALEVRLAATHCRPETVSGAVSDIVTALEEPFKVAVMVTVWSATSTPVLAVKVAEVALAATLIEGKTVNTDDALLESVTAVLLLVDFDKVTVQVVLTFEARLVAAHWSEEIAGGLDSKSVLDCDDPFRVAVMVATWSARSAPVLAVNVAEVAVAGTLTEAGTAKTDAALLESVTTVLLVLEFDRVTVQVVLALEARLAATHCREVTLGSVPDEDGPVTVNSSMMSSQPDDPPDVRSS